MAFTYDLNTAVGRVRLIAADTDATKLTATGGDRTRTDEEIAALLAINGNEARLAAAGLLEGKASEYAGAAVASGVSGANWSDPTARSRQCLALARELRRQGFAPLRVEAADTPLLEAGKW